MKKFVVMFAMVMLLVTSVSAAELKLTIPDAKLSRVTDSLIGLYGPVPTDDEGTPLYTDNTFAKEVLRSWVVSQVLRYESAVAIKEAREAVVLDDELAQ